VKKTLVAIATAGALVPAIATATDGYFSHGYGMKAKGRAGASTAMATDSFGGAVNPATMVWAGDRLDVGIDWFSPKRSAERTGSLAGLDGKADSGSENFLIPEFGYNKMLSPSMSLGVTVYGNGGMNTDYPGDQIPAGHPVCGGFNPGSTGPYNLLCGNGRLGVDLMQLIVAPTFAMKALGGSHSFGISPLFGYQRFKAEGLQGFQGFTPNPATFATDNRLTNRGYDTSTGWGVRVGWMGRITPSVALGAAYSTKMNMQKLDKYRDLFAEEGGFDLPENWNAGVAFNVTPRLTIAADYQRINYSDINSVGNPSTNAGNSVAGTGFTVGSLGCANCRGFGWDDVNVIKIGVEYQYSSALTLRAGYNHTDNPIQSRDVTFNILAPGVVQDHLTAGFTYSLSPSAEITMAYMHAFKNSVTGSSLFNNFGVPAGSEKIQMSEDSLGIALGWKF
jgi:long-chain fatty acid transport protein